MKSLVLAAALLGATTLGTMAQEVGVGGVYAVEGTGLDGGTYTGSALIQGITDTTCSIVWETGGQSSEGFCMRYGSAFSAFYAIEAGGDVPHFGLVMYEIQADGSLRGVWTITGMDGAGSEVLTPQQ